MKMECHNFFRSCPSAGSNSLDSAHILDCVYIIKLMKHNLWKVVWDAYLFSKDSFACPKEPHSFLLLVAEDGRMFRSLGSCLLQANGTIVVFFLWHHLSRIFWQIMMVISLACARKPTVRNLESSASYHSIGDSTPLCGYYMAPRLFVRCRGSIIREVFCFLSWSSLCSPLFIDRIECVYFAKGALDIPEDS